ncbi:hypothetical protein E2C01_047663 [Portunus trituberculatus]|uniref:FLYWCH-type domain-containing protein n=1 Tax=Portunus trituberculatus TaxID=210409 RepID=A0A5B7GB54_PORTR|nr:hypothetical protein [Portunus trituberculatus]
MVNPGKTQCIFIGSRQLLARIPENAVLRFAVTMSEESHREARQVRKIEGQRRGSTVYVFDDQGYVKDRQYNEKLHVWCHLFKSGCHGRGYINLENSTMIVTKDHNHDSQASYIEQM